MPIRVKCPSCHSQMQVPDGSAGKQTRCPHCQTVVRIPQTAAAARPAAAAPQPIGGAAIRIRCPRCSTLLSAAASAAGKTIRCSSCQAQLRVPGGAGGDLFPSSPSGSARADDIDWDSLGPLPPASGPPVGGYSSPAPAGPHAPYRPPAAARAPGNLPSGRESWHYAVPAVFILLWGGLVALGQMVRIGFAVMLVVQNGMPADPTSIVIDVGFGILFLLIAFVMAAGSVAMLRRTNMGLARSAAVLAAFPCTGCLVMPFGIWACVLLYAPDGQRDFD